MTMEQQTQAKVSDIPKKDSSLHTKPDENCDQSNVSGVGNFRGRGRGIGGFSRGGGARGAHRGGRGGINSTSPLDGMEDPRGFDGGRGMRGGRGSRGSARGGYYGEGKQDRILERLKQISGPQVDLPPREESIREFSNHCRLWIGNLPLDITEEDVRELFKPYGKFDEVYFDKNKGFAFVRMDFKSNAEKARQELHLKEYKNRQLKIRFSSPGTALKVRNLSTWVTNELLEKSFSVFGELEKAIVITDERGRSTGEGILEFCKKPCAQLALKRCGDGCFFLTSSPRPVIVESMSAVDDNEGMAEINVNKRNPEYMKERQSGPRFAVSGSFEFEYGLKWKQLYELFDKKKEMLEKELNDEKQKLEEQIEYAKYQHETELLREKLRQREENNQSHQQEYESRQQQWEEHRRMEGERQALIEEELAIKYRQQEEELRRRQEENRQFMQERGGSLLKEEVNDEGYGDHMGGGGWRRNDGYGGNSWRGGGGGGVEAWGGRGVGGLGRGGSSQHWADQNWESRGEGGQHWQNDDRSGYQRGDDLTPAAPRGFSRRGRGGYSSEGGRRGISSEGGRGGYSSESGRGGYSTEGGRGGYFNEGEPPSASAEFGEPSSFRGRPRPGPGWEGEEEFRGHPNKRGRF